MLITLDNASRLVSNIKNRVTDNFTPSTNEGIVTKTIISDSNGKLTIEDIDGYTFLNVISYDHNYPLNVIRFGDYFYVGLISIKCCSPQLHFAVTLVVTTVLVF